MSECNRCRLDQVKFEARKRGERVKLVPSKGALGGFDVVYVAKDGAERDGHRWFMAIGERCECD